MDESPILIVPYMWIGDFVRCHTVVRLLKQRFPARAVDVLTTAMVAPLLDYMPGVRKAIVADLPRTRLALARQQALASRLRAEKYGQALVMPRTWKSALAPWLAGIPVRTGFVGEARFGLINDLRFGERSHWSSYECSDRAGWIQCVGREPTAIHSSGTSRVDSKTPRSFGATGKEQS